MKITDTISVDPGKTALGHIEKSTDSIFRNQVLGTQEHHSLNIVSVLFPSSAAGSSELRKYSVPLRTVFATILIVTGLVILIKNPSAPAIGYAVCSLSFGGFLALGLLTRPLMAAASVFYCIAGALSIRAGVTDMNTFALMFGCAIFCATGAGKYSCDTLIRKTIRKRSINSEKKRRETRMGYKAFHDMI